MGLGVQAKAVLHNPTGNSGPRPVLDADSIEAASLVPAQVREVESNHLTPACNFDPLRTPDLPIVTSSCA